MNGNAKAVDVAAGVLACAATAGVAVALMQALSPTFPFSYATDVAKRCGAITVAALVVYATSGVVRWLRPRVALAITRQLAAVVALVAGYEMLLFGVIAPRIIADMRLPLMASLAIEIIPVASLSALAWGGRTMKAASRVAVFVLATVLCIIAVAVLTPAVFRGIAEQSGWVAASTQHVSGVHEPPFARHMSYIVLAALAGLPFASDGSAESAP